MQLPSIWRVKRHSNMPASAAMATANGGRSSGGLVLGNWRQPLVMANNCIYRYSLGWDGDGAVIPGMP